VIPARGWCFVEPRAFVSMDLRTRVFPVARNQEFFRRTRDITRIEARNGQPLNPGVTVASIEQRIGLRVERLNVVDVSSPARGRGQFRNQESIGFYRPAVRREPGRTPEKRGGGPWRGNETVIRAPRSNSHDAGGAQRPQAPQHVQAQDRARQQAPPTEPRMTQRRPDHGARAPQSRPQGDHAREKDKGRGDRG
jgi:hypothetical protein